MCLSGFWRRWHNREKILPAFCRDKNVCVDIFFFPWNVCLCSNPPHLLAVSHGRVPGLGLPEGNGVVLVNDVLPHLLFSNEKIPARTGRFITVRLPGPKTFKQSVSSAVVNKTVPLKENLCFIFMFWFFLTRYSGEAAF